MSRQRSDRAGRDSRQLGAIRLNSFEEGLAVANNTEYGLTGALNNDDRGRLEIARREFHVELAFYQVHPRAWWARTRSSAVST